MAQTNVHAELKAFQHLARQGYGVYLPRYRKQRRHARRIDQVAAPLFPRYLFVGIDMTTQRWHAIQSTVGITRLVTNGDVPAAVPEGIVEGLRYREDADGFVQLESSPRFAPGDKVRVREGAFCDRLGLFEGINGKQRSAILLELLGVRSAWFWITNSSTLRDVRDSEDVPIVILPAQTAVGACAVEWKNCRQK